MMKVGIFSVLLTWTAIVNCEPPSNNYGTPLGAPISSYGTPNYNANNDHHDYGEPKSYEFGYQVKDDYSGNNYNRQESSDGNQVRGEYRVDLPDGRTQIVTYYADWQTGFHADVRYEGTAQYPEQYNTHQGGNGGYNNVSPQYGAPAANNQNYNNNNKNNGYNNGYNGGYNQAGSATSSVNIKDYSSDSTPYNTNGANSGYNYNNNNNNNFDSYNSGNFAKRPSNEYGAP